jgi:hypothetical protein
MAGMFFEAARRVFFEWIFARDSSELSPALSVKPSVFRTEDRGLFSFGRCFSIFHAPLHLLSRFVRAAGSDKFRKKFL